MTFTHFLFSKLETPKMSPKKSQLRGRFEKQHAKSAEALLKSGLQHLDHIHWSLAKKLSWKKFLLLTWKILGCC